MKKLITVLTPTYNRAHLLPDLYNSLCRQTDQSFDWLVIDDGSTDDTEALVRGWLSIDRPFRIYYVKKENGGKNRAVNDGVQLIATPFTMIVDSDDYLTDDAVAFLSNAAQGIESDEKMIGVAGLRGLNENTPLVEPAFLKNSFVRASNVERKRYHLERDSCEVYKTSILASHPFHVWDNEKFVPEQVVWNQLALEGYSLRWYNRITCITRYQESGMTNNTWILLRDNPMGYAMMYNHLLLTEGSFKSRISNTVQFISCCFLGKKPTYIPSCNQRVLGYLLLLPGWALSRRRQMQIKRFCK